MDDLKEFLLHRLEKLDNKLEEIKDQNVRTSILLETHEKKDEELRNDVKRLGEHFEVNSKLLGDYNDQLREHIRRTEILEAQVAPIDKAYQTKLAVESYKEDKVKKTLVILGGLGTVIGIIIGVLEYFFK